MSERRSLPLVACSVMVDPRGGDKAEAKRARALLGKTSTVEFATRAATSADRVRRYLDAWECAAGAVVPEGGPLSKLNAGPSSSETGCADHARRMRARDVTRRHERADQSVYPTAPLDVRARRRRAHEQRAQLARQPVEQLAARAQTLLSRAVSRACERDTRSTSRPRPAVHDTSARGQGHGARADPARTTRTGRVLGHAATTNDHDELASELLDNARNARRDAPQRTATCPGSAGKRCEPLRALGTSSELYVSARALSDRAQTILTRPSKG